MRGLIRTQAGRPLSQRNTARAIRRAGDNAKLNEGDLAPVSCHDLRHSAIFRWIAAGLNVVVVSGFAGHANPHTTLTRYAHEFEKRERSEDLIAKLAAAGIGGAS
jgi:integrase